MTIALLAAFHREVAPFIRGLEERRRWRAAGLRAWIGRMGSQPVVVVLTGMGAERAVRSLRILSSACLPCGPLELVLSVGFAGGLDPDLALGDVVAGDRLFEAGHEPRRSDPVWIERAARLGARVGPLVTSATVVATVAAKQGLRGDGDRALAVDLESAAIVREAHGLGLPALALRVVLDGADEALHVTPGTLVHLARVSAIAAHHLCSRLQLLLGGRPTYQHWLIRFFRRLVPLVYGPASRSHPSGPIPLLPLRVEGLEHLPAGSLILACNHQSWMDGTVLFAACPFKVRFLAKQELFRLPMVRWLLMAQECLPIRRGTSHQLGAVVRALSQGAIVALFPEGTIPGEEEVPKSAVQPETGLLRGKTGAVRLALESGAPLIPVGLSGTGQALPVEAVPHLRAWPIPKRVPLTVRFGPPLDLSDRMLAQGHPEAVRLATDRLMAAIASLIDCPAAPIVQA